MQTDVQHLASDAMAGRYTLAPELGEAATWIAQRHDALGLQPVGKDYQVPFELRVGARSEGPQRIMIHRRTKDQEIPTDAFVPARISASAKVRGPLVFAGYAARSQPPKAPEAPEIDPVDETSAPASNGREIAHEYDDLGGLELEGKVALILAYAPNLPDVGAMFAVLQTIAEDFEKEAGPPLAAKDEAAMRALHEQARKRIAQLLRPFMHGEKLPDSFWKVDEPMTSRIDLMRLLGPIMAMRKGPQFDPREHALRSKVARLEEAGAVGVIVVQGARSHLGKEAREQDALPTLAGETPEVLPEQAGIPVVHMRWKDADRFLRVGKSKLSKLQEQIDGDLKPRSQAVRGVEIELETKLSFDARQIPNVVAQIPGSERADEIVLIGAHYDHIGTAELGTQCRATERRGVVDEICNGADDNASGTAMILEIARAVKASGVQPRRSLVFAHFAGEELGLLGSKAMAASPPFDREQVVAMINLDMVGRLGSRGLLVGGVGTSDAWMPLLDEIGTRGMGVTYDALVARRSDHASFYRHEIPVLFFFTGTHPYYHRPGDHTDRINVEGMQTIGEVVGEVVWELAQGRPIAYSAPKEGDGLTNGLPGTGDVVKEVEPAQP
jgi:hypothetical protein